MNRQLLFLVFLLIFHSPLFSQSATITNIQVSQRTDGSGFVDVYYNLSGSAIVFYISMEASFNNGTMFSPISTTFLSGNIGVVSPGNNLHIVWSGKGSNNNIYSMQTRIKLISTCGQPFTDSRDSNTYNTVIIGTQCWMAQNLNIGTKINGIVEQTNNGIIEKFCFNNSESNCNIYGGLYQWKEMMQYLTTSGVQGICPTGWHIPTNGEWTGLTNFLGGSGVAAGKMKSTGTLQAGTGLWVSPNTGATNESGFTAFPGGYRYGLGTFYYMGYNGLWWSSSEYDSPYAWNQKINSHSGELFSGYSYKPCGFSVRCVKDTCTSYSSTGISIIPSSNPVCAGTSVTFATIITNGGLSPVFQWKVNGTIITSATNSTYTYFPLNNDVVACVLTSSEHCVIDNPAMSDPVTMIVNAISAPTINGPSEECVGATSVTYATEPGMTNYFWIVSSGGTIISGGTGTSSTITINWNTIGLHTVFVNYTDSSGCASVSGTTYSVSVNILPVSPGPGTHVSTETQIIWNWVAVNGATGYKWSSVNDYLTATDLGNALSKTENGLICNGTYNRYVWAYNSCGYSTETSLISSTLSCFICGSTITINHLIPGGIAPVGKTVTYGTLSGMNGEPSKCWITSNLGSDQQAPAVNDATEASAGWYWQFNRKQGYKHDGTNRTPDALWIEGINESSNWFTANDPCNLELGTQWRIPTYTEWYNVDNIGGWTNWNGPWGSGLKLHAAGFLYPSDGSLYYRGSGGYYWSSTQYSATYGWHLYFDIGYSTMSDLTKAGGFSLRCLRE